MRALAAHLRDMLVVRGQLARLELSVAARQLRRLGTVWTLAALMILVSLPLWLVALADTLHDVLGISRAGWLCLIAGLLTVAATLAMWTAWRRFRRAFVGLEETLEELREDMLWLREWTETAPASSPDSPDE